MTNKVIFMIFCIAHIPLLPTYLPKFTYLPTYTIKAYLINVHT